LKLEYVFIHHVDWYIVAYSPGSMVFNENGRYHENGMWVKTMYGAFSGPE